MRDLLIGSLLVYFSFRALRAPWLGVMAWTVVSVMNPHQLSWHLNTMPVAAMVAIATLIGVLMSREPLQFPWSRETAMLLTLMTWITITWLASGDIEGSYELWKKIMKIDFMILVALLILHSKRHIVALAWALALSIGFFGFKGGVFTIINGGSYRVWGPPTSYIEGNNELAFALVVVIPLLRFIQMQASHVWVRRGLTVTMLLSAAAALGTHSRGALLAIVAMAFVLWLRSAKKFSGGIALVIVGAALVAFMPDQWADRMQTITSYEADASAMGRINAWWMAFNLASDRFFGGGLQIYNAAIFAQYAPNPVTINAAHSIYFQILGEHGFVGLAIYMLMWIFVWRTAGRLRRDGQLHAETKWLSDLGAMCQVSLAGFAVGGAFLSLAYFDLPYNILALVVLGQRWMESKAWLTDAKVGVADGGAATPEPSPVMRQHGLR